ncbi:MAG: hypothetical protein R3A44_11695 [Caldilineaceae bacterium]
MNPHLLQTKLHIPRVVPSDLVNRSPLIDQLNSVFDTRLTLISAPAGFGKTTLAVEWLSTHTRAEQSAQSRNTLAARSRQTGTIRPCWLALDENDNNFRRFFRYFVAALQTIDASLGQAALMQMQDGQLPSADDLLTSLLNEVASYAKPIVIVLDDYHVIQETAIHDAILFWIEHAPANAHLILTTRIEPPFPLALWRSRGQLTEIRATDLRFSVAEIACYFEQVVQVALSMQGVQALEKRTEGWIVGLKMAGLSLQGRDDIDEFIEHFSGNHRFIMDYLTDQVLDRCSAEQRQFLLRTSILERICAPLANILISDLAANNGSNSQALLEEFERANLFIIPLDDERKWYRYHHLFADLLRQRLQLQSPNALSDLHCCASDWFAEQTLVDEALDHALAADDEKRVVQILLTHTQHALAQGHILNVVSWYRLVSDEILLGHPMLALQYGFLQ